MNKWNNKIHNSDCLIYFILFQDHSKSSRSMIVHYVHGSLLISIGLECYCCRCHWPDDSVLVELLPPEERASCDPYCWLFFLVTPPLLPLSCLLESPVGFVYTRSHELNVLLSFVFLLGSSVLLSTSIMGSRVSFDVEIFWHLSMSCVLFTCGFWISWCSSAESMMILLIDTCYGSVLQISYFLLLWILCTKCIKEAHNGEVCL